MTTLPPESPVHGSIVIPAVHLHKHSAPVSPDGHANAPAAIASGITTHEVSHVSTR